MNVPADTPSDFARLLSQARAGDEAAAIEIWNQYYGRLVQYARRHMKALSIPADRDRLLDQPPCLQTGKQHSRY